MSDSSNVSYQACTCNKLHIKEKKLEESTDVLKSTSVDSSPRQVNALNHFKV